MLTSLSSLALQHPAPHQVPHCNPPLSCLPPPVPLKQGEAELGCTVRITLNYKDLVWASLVAQMVKNLPAMLETWVRSLDQKDALEKGMVNHFSILAWKIPWTEEPGGLQSRGSQRVGHDWATNTFALVWIKNPSISIIFIWWNHILTYWVKQNTLLNYFIYFFC